MFVPLFQMHLNFFILIIILFLFIYFFFVLVFLVVLEKKSHDHGGVLWFHSQDVHLSVCRMFVHIMCIIYALGLLMGKCHQFFTEISVRHMIVARYYHFMSLF